MTNKTETMNLLVRLMNRLDSNLDVEVEDGSYSLYLKQDDLKIEFGSNEYFDSATISECLKEQGFKVYSKTNENPISDSDGSVLKLVKKNIEKFNPNHTVSFSSTGSIFHIMLIQNNKVVITIPRLGKGDAKIIGDYLKSLGFDVL